MVPILREVQRETEKFVCRSSDVDVQQKSSAFPKQRGVLSDDSVAHQTMSPTEMGPNEGTFSQRMTRFQRRTTAISSVKMNSWDLRINPIVPEMLEYAKGVRENRPVEGVWNS